VRTVGRLLLSANLTGIEDTMKIEITNASGFQLAKVNTFANGSIHSAQGCLVHDQLTGRIPHMHTEQDLVRYAKENNLTISFQR
jgi:hypothetical protein